LAQAFWLKILFKRMTGGPAKSRPLRDRNGYADERRRPSVCQLACRRALRDCLRIVNRIADCCSGCFHIAMKIIGPCFVCLAIALISFDTYVYFVHVLPLMLEDVGAAGALPTTLFGFFLLSNALYNYTKSVLTDAGTPPEWGKEFEEADEECLADSLKKPRRCQRCDRLKPDRAHHCSVCRRCVMKMDHHCPWINNCVGYGNYRHFCLFLLYLLSCCTFVLIVYGPHFLDVLFHKRGVPRRGTRDGRQYIMTACMIATSIFVALTILGGFHLYLVLTNQTTIEFQMNFALRRKARKSGEYYRNPYDMGRRRNFQQVFGPNPFCRFRWLMPYLAVPPAGDGIVFPSLSRLKI